MSDNNWIQGFLQSLNQSFTAKSSEEIKKSEEMLKNYRDYIELDYTLDSVEEPYLGLDQLFNFASKSKGFVDYHTAFISIQSDYNNGYTDYYTLQATKYDLNKQFIEVVRFKDNNIIGYESGASFSLVTVQNMQDRDSRHLYDICKFIEELF